MSSETVTIGRYQLTIHPIVTAFALSLAVHLALLGIFEFLKVIGLSSKNPMVEWVTPEHRLTKTDQNQEPEIPLIFVEVDPSQATAEPPERETEFYSARNSQASDAAQQAGQDSPKVEGSQDKVFQTLAAGTPTPAQPKPTPQPEPPEPKNQQPPQPEKEVPKPLIPNRGDLLLTKPAEDPLPVPPEEPARERPRTLAQARQEKGLPSQPIELEGGVERHSLQPSFDSKATLFGAYDEAVIAAIRNRWHTLLSQRDYVRNSSGRVVLQFRLKYDGRITEMSVTENTVGEVLGLICQRAVLDPAPYEPWPSDMRRLIGSDYRDVRFTFYYN